MGLSVRLFGKARLFHNGEQLDLRVPPRTLALVAYVILARGTSVTREKLAFELWPECDDVEARSNVRRHIHALRKALVARSIADELLLTNDANISLAPGVDVDVRRYEAPGETSEQIAASVALYSGDLLEGVDDEWVRPARERLRAEQRRRLSRLSDVARSDGDLPGALRYAIASLELEPWDEDRVRECLLLFAENDDRLAALRFYRTFEERLRSELGAEPPAALAELGRAFAAGRAVKRPGFFPVELEMTSFLGRGEELAELERALLESRFVTLAGPPGVGKTRLGLRLARRLEPRFTDGVWFVDLSAASAGASVETAILETLSLGRSVPYAQNAFDELMRAKKMLLVLDNCEHLVGGCARAVARVIRAGTGVRVLATSRTLLRMPGEVVWSVEPLPVPGAGVALFVERSRALRSRGDPVTLDAERVLDVCRRLDGLPLALELAAARLRSMSFGELEERIGERFSLLASLDADTHRGRTLRTTFDWSYGLLAERERCSFRRLAVFRGGWTTAGAAAVLEVDEWQALAALSGLIDKSLVIAPALGSGTARYDMLQSTREYALEALRDAGEFDRVRALHATFVRDAVRCTAADPFTEDRRTDFTWIDCEIENVRAAVEYALFESAHAGVGAAIVRGLGNYCVDRSHSSEGRQWLERALALPGADRADAVSIGIFLSRLCLRQGDTAEALRHANATIAALRGDGSDAALARALIARSRAAWIAADLEHAHGDAAEALELCTKSANTYGRARAQSTLYLAAISAGDVEAATRYASQATALYRTLEAPLELAEALANDATCAYYAGDDMRAVLCNLEAYELVRGSRNTRLVAFLLHNLASVEWRTGATRSGWQRIAEAIELAMEIGYPGVVARSFALIARTAVAEGAAYDAAVFSGAADIAAERHAPVQAVERADHERLVCALEAALAPVEFEMAVGLGRALPFERAAQRAIAFARERSAAVDVSVSV